MAGIGSSASLRLPEQPDDDRPRVAALLDVDQETALTWAAEIPIFGAAEKNG
jgi:hypothetical protein